MNQVVRFNDLDTEYSISDVNVLNTTRATDYFEQIKRINKLPFSKGELFFSDDVWDFGPLLKAPIGRHKASFNFGLAAEPYKDTLKRYVLAKILEAKLKIQSIHRQFSFLYKFFNYAFERGYIDVEDISAAVIQAYLDAVKVKYTPRTLGSSRDVIRGFYYFYAAHFKNLFTREIHEALFPRDQREMLAQKEANKTKDIPKSYFDGYLSAMVKIMNDESETVDHRGIASFLVLLSQTGLRIGEMLALTVDSVESIRVFNDVEAFFLKYRTWKREKGNNTVSWERTFINELSKKAYDTLMLVYEKKRKALSSNCLFVCGNHKRYPMDSFGPHVRSFYIWADEVGYFKFIDVQHDNNHSGLQTVIINKRESPQHEKQKLTFPEPHQFRVRVTTELYEKGVPPEYVNKFMSHLSPLMKWYHISITPNHPQEDVEFSVQKLREIVSGETKLLGPADSLIQRINEFIEANHYSVVSDLDKICTELAKRIPIRQKAGGVCIKSSIRECSNDARTNEFYCAYGVCPNLYHFYYTADISYKQACELAKGFELNRNNKHYRQAEKDLNMLNTIINSRLEPELKETKTMVQREGYESICKKHPEIIYIIDNFETIVAEVEEWKSWTL